MVLQGWFFCCYPTLYSNRKSSIQFQVKIVAWGGEGAKKEKPKSLIFQINEKQ